MGEINKFSVILPVRNGGSYVKECVSSILSQSFPHFNLHILENASTDGTAEWLRSLKDPRIILIEADKPLTIEENWNRITSISKNAFITLIGHDDILYPGYLEEMDQLTLLHPEAGLYQSHFRFINSNGQFIRSCMPMEALMTPAILLEKILRKEIDIMGTGFLMRARDYDLVGGLPDYPNLLFADFELFIELTRGKSLCVSEKELFAFRLHNSTTKSSADAMMQSGFERFIRYLVSVKNGDKQLDETIQKYGVDFIHTYCKGLSHRMLRTPLADRKGLTVDHFIKKCRAMALLLTGREFKPLRDNRIRLAALIDSNAVSRGLFMLFKKIYSKPIYK
jgi:glycosyltransferase involved in cell wall biosynthesis